MAKSSKKVMLGPNALSFTDQSTGISIARGEVVELSAVQLRTPRIRKALNQGHLQYSIGEEPKYSDDDIKRFVARLRKQHGKGMEPSKVAKSYSLEEMKLIAEELGFTPDKEDTAETLVAAIFEDFDSKAENK